MYSLYKIGGAFMNKNIYYYLNLEYSLVIERDDDGSYFAEYPDLKGCMTCGDTIAEVEKLAKNAKFVWLEAALKKNIPILEPKN